MAGMAVECNIHCIGEQLQTTLSSPEINETTSSLCNVYIHTCGLIELFNFLEGVKTKYI